MFIADSSYIDMSQADFVSTLLLDKEKVFKIQLKSAVDLNDPAVSAGILNTVTFPFFPLFNDVL